MLVMSNMMPPTASRERAGKSRLDMAVERRKKKKILKHCGNRVRISATEEKFITWNNERQHQCRHGVQRSGEGGNIISNSDMQKKKFGIAHAWVDSRVFSLFTIKHLNL